VIGVELAKAIVDRFLASRFDGGNSAVKVDAITGFERSQAGAAGRGQGH
jgi:ribose 5-phosphate isomerase B